MAAPFSGSGVGLVGVAGRFRSLVADALVEVAESTIECNVCWRHGLV